MKSTSFPYALLATSVLVFPALAQDSLPIRTSGFVAGSYAVTNQELSGRIIGNLYLRRHDEFVLDAVAIKVERALPTDRVGSGFVIEAMAGGHASVVRATGLDLGGHADVVQAYGSVGFPELDLVASAGKMTTLLGNEVIETVYNPNLSVGNQFTFVENFTDLGVDLAWTGPSGWSARVRVANGWDRAIDNNNAKTAFGKIGWTAEGGSVAVLGYRGSEQLGVVSHPRSGIELLASAKLGPVTVTLQGDAGREESVDADWQAAGLWLMIPLSDGLDLALRGDALDDDDGARTSGALGFPAHEGQKLYSATGTLNIRAIPGALIRPEARYDRSDLHAFNGEQSQWTFALGAAVLF